MITVTNDGCTSGAMASQSKVGIDSRISTLIVASAGVRNGVSCDKCITGFNEQGGGFWPHAAIRRILCAFFVVVFYSFWQPQKDDAIADAFQSGPGVAFGADDTSCSALLTKEICGVVMAPPQDGKVSITKFGLITQHDADKAREAAK
jgi:hypothetical protein